MGEESKDLWDKACEDTINQLFLSRVGFISSRYIVTVRRRDYPILAPNPFPNLHLALRVLMKFKLRAFFLSPIQRL